MSFAPIVVFVPGRPKGQPRGRAFVTGGKARIFTPGTAEAWKGDIATAFKEKVPAEPIATPCHLICEVHLPRPQRRLRKKDPECAVPHDGRPDWDNFGKAISDALEAIGVLADDKWICWGEVRKCFHRKGGRPGAKITLEPIDPECAWRMGRMAN